MFYTVWALRTPPTGADGEQRRSLDVSLPGPVFNRKLSLASGINLNERFPFDIEGLTGFRGAGRIAPRGRHARRKYALGTAIFPDKRSTQIQVKSACRIAARRAPGGTLQNLRFLLLAVLMYRSRFLRSETITAAGVDLAVRLTLSR